MFGILSFLVLIVFHGSYAQTDCIPNPVENITLDSNYTLYWDASTNCDSTYYWVFIRVEHGDNEVQNIMSSPNPFANVSFLPACDRFHFEIVALSNNQASDSVYLNRYAPAPSDADLTISSFVASVQDDATFLSWHVTEKYAYCARNFRLVIRDTVNPIPRDVYTDRNNIFLNDLIPCAQYEFGIMAIYDLQTEGPINLIRYVAPQEVAPLPILETVSVGETYANISWDLPAFSVNRCRITGVEVEGLPFYHRTFPVYDIPERPLFTTSLDGLQPDNLYMLRVSILNDAGSSPIYSMGVQTLPRTGP